jgi:acyl CoA:acetate/3-ketoacid CoA transferase beta subunit
LSSPTCVFEVKEGGGLALTELHPGVTVDDIRAKTGARSMLPSRLTVVQQIK